MLVESVVRSSGLVAHRSTILAEGVTPWILGRALHGGAVFRVRRGWYAVPDAPADVVRAVRVGGSLTAVSAAKLLKLWAWDDQHLHVSVARNASRLRSAESRFEPLNLVSGIPVCIHWRKSSGADTLAVRPIVDVLIDAIECQSEELAVVLLDSALNLKLVSLAELRRSFAKLPRKYRRALSKAEPGAQSGTETLVRLRLRALGLRVRIQVVCGAGRVDILVGDRLVVECQSRAFHTGVEHYARDRARELRLVDEDYLTLTLSYEQVIFDWQAVEAVIRRRVAARDHLWPRNSRSRPSQFRK